MSFNQPQGQSGAERALNTLIQGLQTLVSTVSGGDSGAAQAPQSTARQTVPVLISVEAYTQGGRNPLPASGHELNSEVERVLAQLARAQGVELRTGSTNVTVGN